MGIKKRVMTKPGDYAYNPQFPLTGRTGETPESIAAIEAHWPDHNNLHNPKYERLLQDYYMCVFQYLDQNSFPQKMERQLKRRDLDTVCAYELYQMKKGFCETDVLDMDN